MDGEEGGGWGGIGVGNDVCVRLWFDESNALTRALLDFAKMNTT